MANFSIEQEWERYLKLIRLDPKKMHPIQYQEMKRCFYGAFGQAINLLMNEITELPDEEGGDALADLHDQIMKFFMKEMNREN